MKHIMIGFLLACTFYLDAQISIEIFAGSNANRFFDSEMDPHHSGEYEIAFGHSFGIGIENISIGWTNLGFTLRYDQYGGNFVNGDGGLGGRFTMRADVNKSVISLGINPIDIKLFKRIQLNIGFEISSLVEEKFSGTISFWDRIGNSESAELNERYDEVSSKTNIGLRGRVVYPIRLSKNLELAPQYAYYFGLSQEFTRYPSKPVRSMRHYLGIGLRKVLK